MLLDFQVTVCLRSEQVWGQTRERAGLLFSFLSVLGWLMSTANSPRARRLYKTERCLPGVMAPAVQRLGSALWSRCNLHLQFYSTVHGTACPVTAQHEGPTLLHPPARTYFLFRYEPCLFWYWVRAHRNPKNGTHHVWKEAGLPMRQTS